MKELETTELPNKLARCPYCNYELDAATGQPGRMPKKGDFSVCIECTGILMFEEGYFMKKATDEDLSALKMNAPKSYYEIRLYQKAIKKIK